jgi:hypothetical protein
MPHLKGSGNFGIVHSVHRVYVLVIKEERPYDVRVNVILRRVLATIVIGEE